MKQGIRTAATVLLLAVLLIGCCACTSSINGTYLPEGTTSETAERMYLFTDNKVVLVQFVDGEAFELHFAYEIQEQTVDGAVVEQLRLTFIGAYYDGRNTDIAYHVDGLLYLYQNEPVSTATFVRGNGFLEIDGVKLIKQ